MVDFEKASRKAQEFRQRGELILRCAEKLFLEKGEDKVTVEMIAEEAGIGKGTIYKHFESKDEIYLQLMIRYDDELATLFDNIETTDDKDRLAKDYFMFRMREPDRYALYDRLEDKLSTENSMPTLLEELHRVRASNQDKLEQIISARIAEGKLADVPPNYHIGAAFALVHGAVALIRSEFYKKYMTDDGFFDFLMEVALRMGNRAHLPDAVALGGRNSADEESNDD